jgi:ornithine carbamoyltransferase
MKHLLSIESLQRQEIYEILELADSMKGSRGQRDWLPLAGQCWALIFSKSSTRTRVSFEVGIRELGGSVMFLSAADIQLGRGEPIEDTARVMGRMLDGAVIRTFRQSDVEVFAEYSKIPTINALTDDEHPCQILADLQTIREKLGGVEGRSVCFIGDGACNVAASWLWAAAKLDFELRIAAPAAFQPSPDLMERLGPHARVLLIEDPVEAAKGADVLYTDVWVSMGKEEETTRRLAALAPYQINETLLAHAAPKGLVMHCLPAYRGKEISAETFERHADTLFDQAENRLHAQKAIMQLIAGKR